MVVFAGDLPGGSVLVDTFDRLVVEVGDPWEASIRTGGQRLRPVLLTTTTTILGLLPMALGVGEGAEMRMPMAVTVIGGLLTATVLTLVVVPVMYSLLDRRPVSARLGQSVPVVDEAPGRSGLPQAG